jgi:RND family efflux transporter MFP subunit
MRTLLIVVILAGGIAGAAYYSGVLPGFSGSQDPAPGAAQGGSAAQGQGRGGGGGFSGGGFGGFGGGGGNRGGRNTGPLTVEVGTARRARINAELTVVGNLIGETTVSVAPRAAGRLQEVSVRLGDRVVRGQRIAKIEDFELVEQIKQQEAGQQVALATIRQREADLALAKTNVERARSLFEREIQSKQILDDNEARYQSALAQLDLAKAQAQQSKARLDELQINLSNTIITSPVNGFIARRLVDPGASVGQNAPVVEVVDISRVRLIANVVEKDLKQLQAGDVTRVEVDAFPGETFTGRIARVSPVLDPQTRTAPIEVEIPNPTSRLKPGMYARVSITLDTQEDALVVPASSLVDLGGRRGVFVPLGGAAVFRMVQVGTEQQDIVEVLGGLTEGAEVITTGSGSLRDGDRIIVAGGRGGRGRGEGTGQPSSDSASAGRDGRSGGRSGFQGRSTGAATTGQSAPASGEGRRGGGQFSGRRGGAQSQASASGGTGATQTATQP